MRRNLQPFGRRYTDHRLWTRLHRHMRHFVRLNAYRDLWLLAISFVLWQGALSLNEGRQFAVGVSCAVESAVGQAGYDVITRGATGRETPFVRFLERHGYPLPKIRKTQAVAAGRVYVRGISERVVSQVGPRGSSLIYPDGSLNCIALERLSAVKPTAAYQRPK